MKHSTSWSTQINRAHLAAAQAVALSSIFGGGGVATTAHGEAEVFDSGCAVHMTTNILSQQPWQTIPCVSSKMTLYDLIKQFEKDESIKVSTTEGFTRRAEDVCCRLAAMKHESTAHVRLDEHRDEITEKCKKGLGTTKSLEELQQFLGKEWKEAKPRELARFRLLAVACAIQSDPTIRQAFLARGGELLAATANRALGTFNIADKSSVVAFPRLNDPEPHEQLGRVAAWVLGIAAPAVPGVDPSEARLAAAADALPLVEAMARFTEVALDALGGQASLPVMGLFDISSMMGCTSSLRSDGTFRLGDGRVYYAPAGGEERWFPSIEMNPPPPAGV